LPSLRQLPSGKWQARVYRNGKYESVGSYTTQKEAEIKGGRAEQRIYYKQTLNHRTIRMQDVIDDWFRRKKSEVKKGTYKQLEVIKRLHIEPYFDTKKLIDITRDDVTEWIYGYQQKLNKWGVPKYSYGSCLKFLITLKDIFNHAMYIMEILEKSPAFTVKLGTKGTVIVKKDIKYYKLPDLNNFLDYLYHYNPLRFREYKVYFYLVFFLSRTGLRISEALALKWSDIDGNRLDVNKQVSRDYNNKVSITTLKTKSSYRNIELDEETVLLLMEFRRIQNKQILKHKKFKRNPDLIIFQTYKGNYVTPSTVRETLKHHCLQAGVEYKGTHAYRHTHAVLGLEAGADLYYISKRLGHGDITTTANTYLDVTPQYESSELAKITNHFSENMARTWHKDLLAK